MPSSNKNNLVSILMFLEGKHTMQLDFSPNGYFCKDEKLGDLNTK